MAAFPPRPTAILAALVLLLAACSTSAPTAVAAAAPGPDDAAYRVHLRAAEGGSRWDGHASVAFTNTSDRVLVRVWLRLWANGVDGCRLRAVRVTGIDGGSVGRLARACTALAVDLDAPLAPGERVRIGFDLRIAVPERNDRFGSHGGVSLLGGALPILAVLDEGGWHLDPYVDLGESFYSLTSRYRVTLDTGAGLAVATTGQLVEERHADGRVRRTFAAADVREFAIAAGPFHRVSGTAGDTDVVVWFNPAATSAETARRVLRTSRTAMSAFSDAFGAYPYPEVDVVTSAFTTFGGMEYPQIVFSNPDRFTVAHELAHQWWWGIVGNDEFAEPWLDESLATWSQYLPFSPWRSCGRYDWPSPTARISNGMDYWRDHPEEYGTVYSGGGCMLASLAHEMGTEALVGALAAHVDAHRLGVTDGDAFRATVGDAAATAAPDLDMGAFWAEWRAD